MDTERAKRYKDKLNFMDERCADVEEWTSSGISDFTSDKKTRLAVYKAFQELIETSLDIAAMVCKDSRIVPRDDYTNIEELYNRNIIDERLNKALAESNGLRNRLVHRYNSLDDRTAFESIHTLIPAFKQLEDVMNRWLKKNL